MLALLVPACFPDSNLDMNSCCTNQMQIYRPGMLQLQCAAHSAAQRSEQVNSLLAECCHQTAGGEALLGVAPRL